eukprot:m.245538 g.245538  ORF g.245538 m.245538 type:complete len:55 (+) comp15365_c1_seq43:1240-1404(+)
MNIVSCARVNDMHVAAMNRGHRLQVAMYVASWLLHYMCVCLCEHACVCVCVLGA